MKNELKKQIRDLIKSNPEELCTLINETTCEKGAFINFFYTDEELLDQLKRFGKEEKIKKYRTVIRKNCLYINGFIDVLSEDLEFWAEEI